MRRLALVLLLASLSACVSIKEAPAGPYAVGQSHVVLGRMWSDVSALGRGLPKDARLLSIDGPLLNQLYITGGLAEGTPLIKAPTKQERTPVVRANMSATERMEFVADSLPSMGFQRVETSRPRAGKMGAHDALRFDLTAKTREGMDMKGTALAAEVGGKLHLIVYMAPAEHYFDALLPEVEAVMTSATVG